MSPHDETPEEMSARLDAEIAALAESPTLTKALIARRRERADQTPERIEMVKARRQAAEDRAYLDWWRRTST